MAINCNGVVSHVGLVLGFSHEHWNDSMHITSRYAKVWNPTTGRPDSVYYTDDFGNECGSFTVDATPEVLAAFQAYETARETERTEYLAHLDYVRVERNKVVSVNRGRKVPKGTTGRVFWIGNNGYGESVGIITLDGAKHFTAMANVDVITASPEDMARYETNAAESKAQWLAANPRPERTRANDYRPRKYRNYAGWTKRA